MNDLKGWKKTGQMPRYIFGTKNPHQGGVYFNLIPKKISHKNIHATYKKLTIFTLVSFVLIKVACIMIHSEIVR